jgi:hypothetical protein
VVRLGEGRVVGVPVAPKTTMSYCRLCFVEAIAVVSLVREEMMQMVRIQWWHKYHRTVKWTIAQGKRTRGEYEESNTRYFVFGLVMPQQALILASLTDSSSGEEANAPRPTELARAQGSGRTPG